MRITGRIFGQGVVRPPSARITTSAREAECVGELGVLELQAHGPPSPGGMPISR